MKLAIHYSPNMAKMFNAKPRNDDRVEIPVQYYAKDGEVYPATLIIEGSEIDKIFIDNPIKKG